MDFRLVWMSLQSALFRPCEEHSAPFTTLKVRAAAVVEVGIAGVLLVGPGVIETGWTLL